MLTCKPIKRLKELQILLCKQLLWSKLRASSSQRSYLAWLRLSLQLYHSKSVSQLMRSKLRRLHIMWQQSINSRLETTEVPSWAPKLLITSQRTKMYPWASLLLILNTTSVLCQFIIQISLWPKTLSMEMKSLLKIPIWYILAWNTRDASIHTKLSKWLR
jgi:hypothetical protein